MTNQQRDKQYRIRSQILQMEYLICNKYNGRQYHQQLG